MTSLFITAVNKADQVRERLGLDMYKPMNVFDACMDLGVTLRFVNINMEGMYVVQDNGSNPTILISNQRPLPRRSFTCAHELGHHFFHHGSRLDNLSYQDFNTTSSADSEELLVNIFAGALLMPVAGIQSEFAARNLLPDKATPLQFYVISSFFGIGYQTLIVHSRTNKLISVSKEKQLIKHTPSKILHALLGSHVDISHFKIIDSDTQSTSIDLEVSNYLILPSNLEIEGDHLLQLQQTAIGTLYRAIKPGIIRAAATDETIAFFIRIQNTHYVGLVENRHLETNE